MSEIKTPYYLVTKRSGNSCRSTCFLNPGNNIYQIISDMMFSVILDLTTMESSVDDDIVYLFMAEKRLCEFDLKNGTILMNNSNCRYIVYSDDKNYELDFSAMIHLENKLYICCPNLTFY